MRVGESPTSALGAATVRVTLEFILSFRGECCDRFCERELQAWTAYILPSETQEFEVQYCNSCPTKKFNRRAGGIDLAHTRVRLLE